MTHIYIFNVSLLVTCLYAFWGGGGPERGTAIIFVLAATVTYLAPHRQFVTVEPMLLLIDLLVLLAITGIALRANRYWPLYESALHILLIAIHGVKAYQPDFVYWMYNGASGKIAYPTLVLLALGVFRHRQRIAAFGSERDWSPLRTQLA